ncbi:hypothetical protein HY500_03510 [Candidatus Woesearchaeota archaeon]|nr:hypothetical protein [Candidatus Woesearchaeota archaeon]
MLKKRGGSKHILFSKSILFLIVFSFFAIHVHAQEDAAVDVNTVIIVNGDDAVDNAIALAISRDLGIPVFYTQKDEISREVLTEIKEGSYGNVDSVVILGGKSVISDGVESSLNIAGVVGGFDAVRIGGMTGTDTAINAINYFYGPKMIDGVTLVRGGDNEIIQLSAYLHYPIIPTADELQENVLETLNFTKVAYANLVMNSEDLNLKQVLSNLNVKIDKEFYGNKKALEKETRALQDNKIVIVEEGTVLPIIPNSFLAYYEDEDNDGVDDESGLSLEGIFSTIYNDNRDYGIESLYFYSDDQRGLAEIEYELYKKNVPLEAYSYEDVQELIDNSLKMNKRHIKEINQDFADNNLRVQEKFKENSEEFEKQIVPLVENIKIFCDLNEDNLSLKDARVCSEILGISNDLFIKWKLVHAFITEY